MATIISGADYLAIAQAYATARKRLVDTVQYFDDAVNTIVLMDDVVPTIDLLGEFYSAAQVNRSRLESTTGFEASVRAIQQHVLTNAGSGVTLVSWIEDNVPGGMIPDDWAVLSKIVGYDIDSVSEAALLSSSSS